MIIIRYLVRETLKSQLAILFVLMLIFFSQKSIDILGAAVQGNIPSNLVLPLLGLGVPEMAQLILPLSLFLGLLMTYSRLYTESEITVMHACGLGKDVLVKAALVLATLTALVAIGNITWMLPWSSQYQEQVLADAKANPGLAAMVEGQFKTTKDGNFVLYIGDVKGNNFQHVFLAQLRAANEQRPSVVVADSGYMKEDQEGRQVVVLNEGTRYEGTALLRDFRITDFVNYQAVVDHKSTEARQDRVEQKNMLQLWKENTPDVNAEFHWRLTIVFSVVVMALMVVPLSEVNPRQGRVLSMLPAMLLYLIFFLLQSTLRNSASKDDIDPKYAMWIVNFGYLALAIVLNMWNTLPMRRIRVKFSKGVA
ncbi:MULTISPECIES: LPS export ABC transporter permease LptF [unclassified Providencia]|uniref:LPS export ABC transporter permease LptF n=1 Tax=unclassified Providencia TaxID=2633465 RepID=UPI000E97806C|nr:LPS export ABC transporter permease LptF [Providencia sp.]HBO22162.1 LPS export ABC transporter permease LptF [Providencia sp.]